MKSHLPRPVFFSYKRSLLRFFWDDRARVFFVGNWRFLVGYWIFHCVKS
jgi:hypothetical protein